MSARDRLNERLANGEVVLIDGGMGTELQARGVPMSSAAWSGLANLDHSDVVQEIHEDNIRAGAEVVLANTFATSRLMLRAAGVEERYEEVNRRAVEAAMLAREETGRPDVAVAGSISDGVAGASSDFDDQVPLAGQALRDAFSEHARTLANAGVDLLALEMMTSPSYGVAAVETALETGLPVWLGVSAGLSSDGKVAALGGVPGSFEELLDALARPELAAVNVMHTSIEATTPALEAVRKVWRGSLGAYPESGDWIPPNWVFNDFTPEAFASTALGWVRDGGVRIIGGCCGMRPNFIAALRDALAAGTSTT